MNPPADSTLQITRVFHAPLARVYAAWSDLDMAKQWWGPEGCETLELVVDFRIGGKYRWRLNSPYGEMTAHGEYREIVPRKKIVYTWQWADDPDWKDHESLVTVEFREKGATATELCLTHENLPTQQSRENHAGGWNSSLDKLDGLIKGQADL